jgi:Holliday junction resolvase
MDHNLILAGDVMGLEPQPITAVDIRPRRDRLMRASDEKVLKLISFNRGSPTVNGHIGAENM